MKDHHEHREDHDSLLLREIREFREHVARLDKHIDAILHRVEQKLDNIMEAITAFANRVDVAFEAISTSVDDIVTSQAGLAGDIAGLKALIEKLQTTPGTLSPEDQALLDALEVKVNATVSKTAAVSAALKELDAQTANTPTP